MLCTVFTHSLFCIRNHSFASLTWSISDTPQLLCKHCTRTLFIAFVASVSVQFGSKELQGDEWFFFWLSPHFPRRQNTENPVPRLFLGLSLLPNPTKTLATQASLSMKCNLPIINEGSITRLCPSLIPTFSGSQKEYETQGSESKRTEEKERKRTSTENIRNGQSKKSKSVLTYAHAPH